MPTVTVNGEEIDLPDGTTILDLLKEERLNPAMIVEHNRAIIHKDSWPMTELADDDRLEIVIFIGAGSRE